MKLFVLPTFVSIVLGSLQCNAEPLNSAVVVGNSMTMNCESTSNDETIQWRFRNPYTSLFGEVILSDGSSVNGESSIAITRSQGIATLTKNKIRLEDAGIYTCFVKTNNKTAIARSAELIVLRSDPTCESSLGNDSLGVKEGEVMEIQCKVSFIGNVDPVMEWFRGDGEKLEPRDVTINKDSIFQKVKLQMKASDNGLVFSCLLHFESRSNASFHQPAVIRAKNNPEYNFRWNFSVSVHYGPLNLTIENLKISYEYGETLLCHADGNPLPSYQWISLADDSILYGPILRISRDLMSPGVTHLYQCLAVNSESGANISKVVSITIDTSSLGYLIEESTEGSIEESKGLFQNPFLFAVLIPTCVGLLLALIAGLVLRKRFSKHDSVEVPIRNDNPERGTNPRNTGIASYIDLLGDDVTDYGSSEALQMDGAFPYSKLNVNRALPIPPIYAQLETEYLKPTDSQMSVKYSSKDSLDRYTNIDDIFVASEKHLGSNGI